MNTEELKRAVQAEMGLRGVPSKEYAETIVRLRQAVPDWCEVVLELIDENEKLRQELESQRGKEGV